MSVVIYSWRFLSRRFSKTKTKWVVRNCIMTVFFLRSSRVIASSKGPNKLCRYKRDVVISEACALEVNEKYFHTNCRPAGILLDVNALKYFIFSVTIRIL